MLLAFSVIFPFLDQSLPIWLLVTVASRMYAYLHQKVVDSLRMLRGQLLTRTRLTHFQVSEVLQHIDHSEIRLNKPAANEHQPIILAETVKCGGYNCSKDTVLGQKLACVHTRAVQSQLSSVILLVIEDYRVLCKSQ